MGQKVKAKWIETPHDLTDFAMPLETSFSKGKASVDTKLVTGTTLQLFGPSNV